MGVEWGGGWREPWTRGRVIVGVGTGVVLVDQLTKDAWVRWWDGHSELNPELVMGIPAPVMGAVIVLIVLLMVVVWKMMNPPWAVGMVIGGGMSNMIDRLMLNGVQDFIQIGEVVIFNIADVAVIVGLVAWSLTRRRGVTNEESLQVPARGSHRGGPRHLHRTTRAAMTEDR